MPVVVDPDGHLMGAFGVALLAADAGPAAATLAEAPSPAARSTSMPCCDFEFVTREVECSKCANHCEIICVYRDEDIIDSLGQPLRQGSCENGSVIGGGRLPKRAARGWSRVARRPGRPLVAPDAGLSLLTRSLACIVTTSGCATLIFASCTENAAHLAPLHAVAD